MIEDSRRILWEGCLNVRDLGGYAAADGKVTRAGSLIRSDNLARLTAAGQQAVRETSTSLIIDLRSPYELGLEANPFAQMSAANPPYLNLPLLDEADAEGIALVNAAPTLTEMYEIMLDRFRSNIGEIMKAVATAPPGAVVFHCHSGKDRTGLITALLLKLAGVPEAAIAEDYALSDAYLSTLYSEMLNKKTNPEERARLAAQLTSNPEVILGALSHLEEQYYGVEPYLEVCGLNQETRQRLHERLLEPMPRTTG
jgi:protein-tyrosine phosphatase